MPGRPKKDYNYDDPTSNMEFLADKMAADDNLAECRGLLRVAGIGVDSADRAARLDGFIRAIDTTNPLALAGRDLIGLWDKPLKEIKRIFQLRAPGQTFKPTNKMHRQTIAGDGFDVGRDQF